MISVFGQAEDDSIADRHADTFSCSWRDFVISVVHERYVRRDTTSSVCNQVNLLTQR
jgi:hypothetical protein